MNAPDQDELDVRLARVVYGRVARRWCYRHGGEWELRRPCSIGGVPWRPAARHALLWCYVPDPRYPREWAPVPAFGEDGGRILAALEAYRVRRPCKIDIDLTQDGCCVTIWPAGPRPARYVAGSTFALAARAAVLALEEQR